MVNQNVSLYLFYLLADVNIWFFIFIFFLSLETGAGPCCNHDIDSDADTDSNGNGKFRRLQMKWEMLSGKDTPNSSAHTSPTASPVKTW